MLNQLLFVQSIMAVRLFQSVWSTQNCVGVPDVMYVFQDTQTPNQLFTNYTSSIQSSNPVREPNGLAVAANPSGCGLSSVPMDSCCMQSVDQPNSFNIHSNIQQRGELVQLPTLDVTNDGAYCRLDILTQDEIAKAESIYITATGTCIENRITCSPTGIIQIFARDGCQGQVTLSRQLFTQKQFMSTDFGPVDARLIRITASPFRIKWFTTFPIIIDPFLMDSLGVTVAILYAATLLCLLSCLLFFTKTYQPTPHYRYIIASILGLLVSLTLDIASTYTLSPIIAIFATNIMSLTTLLSVLTTIRYLDPYYPSVVDTRIFQIRVWDINTFIVHFILVGPTYLTPMVRLPILDLWKSFVAPLWILGGFLVGLGTYIAIINKLYKSILGTSTRNRISTLCSTYTWSPAFAISQTVLGVGYVVLYILAYQCATLRSDQVVRAVKGCFLTCILTILILIHFMFGYLEQREVEDTSRLNSPKFKNSILF